MSNTPAQRKAALKELEDKQAHANYLYQRTMHKPIPVRSVSRDTIHQQKNFAELRDAFSVFGVSLV